MATWGTITLTGGQDWILWGGNITNHEVFAFTLQSWRKTSAPTFPTSRCSTAIARLVVSPVITSASRRSSLTPRPGHSPL